QQDKQGGRGDQQGDRRDRGDQQDKQGDRRDRGDQQGDRNRGNNNRGGQRGDRWDDDNGGGGGRRRRQRGRDRKRGRGRGNDFGGEVDTQIREDDVLVPVAGILDVLDNYAFVRTSGYLPGSEDVYVPLGMVRKNGLRKGDA